MGVSSVLAWMFGQCLVSMCGACLMSEQKASLPKYSCTGHQHGPKMLCHWVLLLLHLCLPFVSCFISMHIRLLWAEELLVFCVCTVQHVNVLIYGWVHHTLLQCPFLELIVGRDLWSREVLAWHKAAETARGRRWWPQNKFLLISCKLIPVSISISSCFGVVVRVPCIAQITSWWLNPTRPLCPVIDIWRWWVQLFKAVLPQTLLLGP